MVITKKKNNSKKNDSKKNGLKKRNNNSSLKLMRMKGRQSIKGGSRPLGDSSRPLGGVSSVRPLGGVSSGSVRPLDDKWFIMNPHYVKSGNGISVNTKLGLGPTSEQRNQLLKQARKGNLLYTSQPSSTYTPTQQTFVGIMEDGVEYAMPFNTTSSSISQNLPQTPTQTSNIKKKSSFQNAKSRVANFLHLTPKNSARAVLANYKKQNKSNKKLTANNLRRKRQNINKNKKTKNTKELRYLEAIRLLTTNPDTEPVTKPVTQPFTEPGRIFTSTEVIGDRPDLNSNGKIYLQYYDELPENKGYTLKPEYVIKLVNGTPQIVKKTDNYNENTEPEYAVISKNLTLDARKNQLDPNAVINAQPTINSDKDPIIYTELAEIKPTWFGVTSNGKPINNPVNMTPENIKTTLKELEKPISAEDNFSKKSRENQLSKFVKQIPVNIIKPKDYTILQNIILQLSDKQYEALTEAQVHDIVPINLINLPKDTISIIKDKLSVSQKNILENYKY